MQHLATVLGLLAAVGSAYAPGKRHLHFPQSNSTQIQSQLTTTAAPTAAPTGIILPSTALSSAIAPGNATTTQGGNSPVTTRVTDVVTDKTMTLTLGTGSFASVVTRVYHATIRETITVPCSQGNAEPTASEPTAPTGGDSTTTITETETTKIYRTVKISRTKPTNTPPGNGDGGSLGYPSSANCPAVTVTVTAKEYVTMPVSAVTTVYVTMGAPSANCGTYPAQPATTDDSSGSNGNGGNQTPQPSPTQPPPGTHSASDGDETTTLTATATVVPYPAGNGTHPSGTAYSSGHVGPTGFARIRH
ncbi:uncharacterized protein UV8b_00776 [Ustilaginoidea virens]|uniref:Uncharacterized protein n=1 Tax=Ustilaginoidea virens TaxID=1159556 RepID=A0A063BT07_USTVR|nr:uncharacterized protein UV8b_00776 [Ustilaginoidea virens]QUC16535.1 hypothetical protein UV8b_00776 [Ustilaginoidea virens]GAO16659.1 hypothetical protein UVI_02012790 [Ustilaginoidea virens]